MRGRRTRLMVVLAYPGAAPLDIAGPLDVFHEANFCLGVRGRPPLYELRVASLAGGRFRTSNGTEIYAQPCKQLPREIDTLLVSGGYGVWQAAEHRALVAWLREAARRTRRTGSICNGAFVLAAAGLLDGKRATTHWKYCAQLAAQHPNVTVEADPIFVRDGNVFTAAGGSAGLDLALGLVEDDLGHELALAVARELVLFLKRPGGQSQFSAQLSAQQAERPPVRDLQSWIVDHPDADLSIEALAARAAMSPRNFQRVFAAEVGVTPARYAERIRVEAARRRLEESRDGVEEVAARSGFGSAEGMRKAFLRVLGVSPAAYRSRFRARA